MLNRFESLKGNLFFPPSFSSQTMSHDSIAKASASKIIRNVNNLHVKLSQINIKAFVHYFHPFESVCK